MKYLLTITICLIMAMTAQAQMQVFGIGGAGVVASEGNATTMSVVTGANVPLYTKVDDGLMFYDRLQYYYTNKIGGDDSKGFVNFLCVRRNLNFISKFFTKVHVDFGGGLAVETADQRAARATRRGTASCRRSP